MNSFEVIFLTVFFILSYPLQEFIKAEEEISTNIANCYLCSLEGTDSILRCASLALNDTDVLNFECISTHQKNYLTTLIIENSTIPNLNLSFIKENEFSGLSEIEIYDSNVTSVTGNIPCHISLLKLSSNFIRHFNAVLVATVEDPSESDDIIETIDIDDEGHFTTDRQLTNCTSGAFSLEVKNNLLEELPTELVESNRLKSLMLSGNPLKCEFIWENVWDNLDCHKRTLECRSLFVDQNMTTCQFYRQKMVPSGIFHYNLTQIFDSKIILENECTEMNKTCDCHPFNLLRGEMGKPTVYLTVNCVGKNLTELPRVSPYTWELNVSHNHIKHLKTLNSSMYKNLRRLDISHNYIKNLNDLTSSSFIRKFDLLYINSNRFEKFPNSFFTKVKNSEGKATLKVGSNLECDCLTATQTKGRLIEIQNNILDINEVLCWNIMQMQQVDQNDDDDENDVIIENCLRLKDLKITDVCSMNDSDDDKWIVWIIIAEVVCIVGVILKVCYDWRNYQRTGILPWIAQKLPRLPCDGILE